MFYDKEFLGKKFKEYRKKANLTQEELFGKNWNSGKTLRQIRKRGFYAESWNFFQAHRHP